MSFQFNTMQMIRESSVKVIKNASIKEIGSKQERLSDVVTVRALKFLGHITINHVEKLIIQRKSTGNIPQR